MVQQRPSHLLVVTRFNPLGGVSGAGTYLFSILSYLRRNGVRVTLCWSERPAPAARRGWWTVPQETAEAATLLMPGALCLGRLRLFPGVWTGPLKAAVRRLGKAGLAALGLREKAPRPPANATAQAAQAPYQWDRPPDPYEYEFFGNAIARLRPDAVLFNYCWMTPIADRLAQRGELKVFTLTHDLRHLYSTLVEGEICHTEGADMTRAAEADFLRRGDVILAIREDDAGLFRQMLPGKAVLTVTPSLIPQPPCPAPIPNRCLFVAAENAANREGIEWFLREAWPQVRAARPNAELHLCGTICKALPQNTPPGVVCRGFVADLGAAYREAAVVLVPLLRGSGVKIKLMEALAHGKACVSTPIGTEGVPALDACVCLARTAAQFAGGVVQLLGDPRAREALEHRATDTVRTRFSAETCYRPLLEALRK